MRRHTLLFAFLPALAALVMGASHASAASTEDPQTLRAMQSHLGAIETWRVGPETVARHCRRLDPEGVADREARIAVWQTEQANLLGEAEDRFSRLVPLTLPASYPPDVVRAGVKVELLKIIFLGRTPEEATTICRSFPHPDFPLWSASRIEKVRAAIKALDEWAATGPR